MVAICFYYFHLAEELTVRGGKWCAQCHQVMDLYCSNFDEEHQYFCIIFIFIFFLFNFIIFYFLPSFFVSVHWLLHSIWSLPHFRTDAFKAFYTQLIMDILNALKITNNYSTLLCIHLLEMNCVFFFSFFVWITSLPHINLMILEVVVVTIQKQNLWKYKYRLCHHYILSFYLLLSHNIFSF